MTHTPLLANVARGFRSAGLLPTRRQFLATAAAVGSRPLRGAPARPNYDVAIIGAGLAGLACADNLPGARVYEAASRPGGRCYSLPGYFPGQTIERGGEFIDTAHKTMIAYARQFGLTLEDVTKQPGEVTYFFDGVHVPESRVVEEFRALVPAMKADLRLSSGAPTAAQYNSYDRMLDLTSLAAYLQTRRCGPIAYKAIEQAYLAEYGLPIEEQSCLNFLLFIHADRRSKFTPFGVSSDERYHVVEGNDRVVQGLAARHAARIEYGRRLVAIRKTAAGRIELTFADASVRTHDAAVLTIPFTVLRGVALHPSLGLPPWKIQAVQQLGYGVNAKMMVGFGARPWRNRNANGSSYSNLANHQATWETNPILATPARAVLTDYSSAARAARLNPANPQLEATRFVNDLDRVFPGSAGAFTGQVHLEHWPSNQFVMAGYTCYRPGQFTTIAGNEATPVGNLFFAGEHADSFYSWQGFLEGACLSGIAAARAIVKP